MVTSKDLKDMFIVYVKKKQKKRKKRFEPIELFRSLHRIVLPYRYLLRVT